MEHGRKGLSLPLSHLGRLGHPALSISAKLILANMQITRHPKTFSVEVYRQAAADGDRSLCACSAYPILFCPLTLTLFDSALNVT